MTRLLRLWFGLTEPVSPTAYAGSGFGLMGLKYVVEALLIHQFTGRWLTPLDYFSPLLTSRQAAVGDADFLLLFLIVWTLPFLWIGVSMTVRRAEDAGRSPFLALLYFVPVVNYLLMLALCVLPSRAPSPPQTLARREAIERGNVIRSAFLGAGLGVAIALGMVGLSVLVFGSYGTTLFVGTPFVMGATAAFVFNGTPRSAGATIAVAALSVLVASGAILIFALEGILCLFMAAPLALVMALMGAWFGRAIAQERARMRGLAAMLLPLPLLAGMEAKRPPPPPSEVRTVVEIAAPADVVWRHVVTFSELREPPAWLFRLGIAYPRRATIAGSGVGALRRCEFSTGAFVEPITAWEEPHRLAFDVAAQPPAMEEWSPYRNVAARHLDGYLRVRDGEFRLQPLPGGRTRLEGRTRYEMSIYPAAYWRMWSDPLIHSIHQRVLAHIQALSETEELTVFAAASLTDALAEVARGFEKSTGHEVVFNLGGSNDLSRQIKAGAPADVFFSADKAQMDGLQAEGLVRAQDRVDVLSNVLVTVVPAASVARLSGPGDLRTVRRLALADPQAVPAGVYARTWLESIGLWDELKGRIIPTLNVRAALSAVESENVDAGLVYRTDAAISKRVKVAFEVPRDQGPAIVYPLAPLARSRKRATGDLVRYLTSAPAREVYRRYGFVVLVEE